MKKNNKIVRLLWLIVILLPFVTVLSIHIPLNLGSFNIVLIIKELFVIIIIILSMSIIFRRKHVKLSMKEVYMLFFIIYGVLHIVISNIIFQIGFIEAIDKFRVVYLYPIMFLSLYLVFKETKYVLKFDKLKLILIIQMFIMIIFGFIQMLLKDQFLLSVYKDEYSNMHLNLLGQKGVRTVSLLYNPIILGIFLNIGLVILLFSNMKSRIWRVIKWILIISSIILIFTTLSRISYIIMALIILFYFLFHKINTSKLFFKLALIPLLLVVMLGVEYSDNNLISKRLSQITSDNIANNDRVYNWDIYLDSAFRDSPFLWLWGSGLGSSNSDNSVQSEYVKKVENSFVSIMGETGIIGLIIYVGIILRYIYNCIYLYSKGYKNEANIFLGWIFIFLIASLTNDVYKNNPFSFYFWMFLFMIELKRMEYKSDR